MLVKFFQTCVDGYKHNFGLMEKKKQIKRYPKENHTFAMTLVCEHEFFVSF